MAIPANTQALVAAFAFGIVLNTASAALFLNIKGHGSSIFRDGLRLVLITFLFSAALWAQIGFITTAIDVTAGTSCVVAALFTTIFDQTARVSIEQYLLWAINRSDGANLKASAWKLVPQVLILGRTVLGAVFAGFTRRQTELICAPVSSVLALSITTVLFDAVIIAILAGLTVSAGLFAAYKAGDPRGKAIVVLVAGLAIWFGTSVTLVLGLQSIDVMFRTALPAAGLCLLMIIITGSTELLSSSEPRPRVSRPPESPRSGLDTRDISTSGSGSSGLNEYPPIRYEDLKRAELTTANAFAQPREAPQVQPSAGGGIPQIATAVTGVKGVGGVPIQGALFPPLRAATEPAPQDDAGTRRISIRPQANQQYKKSLFDLRGGPARTVTLGRLAISNPILASHGEQNPLNKIATIDLATAGRLEKERREQALQAQRERQSDGLRLERESALIAKRPAPQPPGGSPDEGPRRTVGLKRKEVASVGSPQSVYGPTLEPMPAMALTTSAQLSPGVEEMRRRSPRHAQAEVTRSTSTRIGRGPAESPMTQEDAAVVEDKVEIAVENRPTRTSSPVQPLGGAASPPRQLQRAPSPPVQQAVVPLVLADAPPQMIGGPTRADRATMAPQPGQFSAPLYAAIRPSRQKADSPNAAAPEAPKTALQRRPTIGLPGNPRSRVAAPPVATAVEGGLQRQQTVMFVNNIVYDDPSVVQSIMDGANPDAKATAPPQPPPKPVTAIQENESNSVVNRPRPIPRHSEKDRGIFPAEPSPNQTLQHRRNKSGGSAVSRKSILLRSAPGSPTQLPPLPLPPPPKSAVGGGVMAPRPHPNDTRSMTFDEKMSLFYQAHRRSSVPELPPPPPPQPPSNFFDLSETNTHRDNDDDDDLFADGRRTTKTSVGTGSILDVDEIPRRPAGQEIRYTDQSDNPLGADTWIAGGLDTERDSQGSRPSVDNAAGRRASSPVIPPPATGRDSAWTETTDSRTQWDVTTTVWGSVHSPVVAVPIHQGAMTNAKPTYIQAGQARKQPQQHKQTEMAVADLAPPPALRSSADSKETMTIMLDASTMAEQCDGAVLLNKVYQGGWHRRVGDECPTFSERREKMRSRMPPPTPLLLAGSSTRNPVIVKAAVPLPLETPDHALQAIHAQLKKLDQPNRASVESQARRLALLENLESEMDVQQGHWQDLKQNMASRDSLSTISTVDSRPPSVAAAAVAAPAAAPEPVQVTAQAETQTQTSAPMPTAEPSSLGRGNGTGANSSNASSGAERRASRRDKMRGGANLRRESIDDATASNPGSGRSRVGAWQKRLMEAQLEFADLAPELLTKRNMNFLALGQLASPTPPDTDEEDIAGLDDGPMAVGGPSTLTPPRGFNAAVEPLREAPLSLWEPPALADAAQPKDGGLLWTRSARPARQVHLQARHDQAPTIEPVARRVPRKQSETLEIYSRQLWQVPRTKAPAKRRSSPTGMWAPSYASNQSVPSQQASPAPVAQQSQPQIHPQRPRPSTVRPPRRNRRMTLLPDILESPKPLPDKRGTLGIFQFPWGERSDVATLHPRQTMFAMAGTMTSGGPSVNAALEARARQLEAAEYSSSFFDDYDDEEGDDGDMLDSSDEDGSEDDGSDDFDETTLWEIASLLKTENVPSKNSLFPPPARLSSASSVVLDDYLERASDDEERSRDGLDEDDEARESIVVGMEGLTTTTGLRSHEQAVVVAVEEEEKEEEEETLARDWPRQSLWEAPAAHKKTTAATKGNHGVGLARPDSNTWNRYDATSAQDTARAKPRPSQEPAAIEKSGLWQGAAATNFSIQDTAPAGSTMWVQPQQQQVKTSSRKIKAKPPSRQNSKGKPGAKADGKTMMNYYKPDLWAPTVAAAEPAAASAAGAMGGMFQARPATRAAPDTRSMDVPAAAVGMVRKARAPDSAKPLAKLGSSSLWDAATSGRRQAERNWILVGTVPSAPSVPVAAGLWSNAAIETRSSVGTGQNGGLFQVRPKAHDKRSTDAPLVAAALVAKPRRPERKSLQKLSSTTLWAAAEAAGSKERHWISHPSTPSSSSNSVPPHRNVSPAAWSAALHEAVAASYPWLASRVATPAEWDAALEEAVVRSGFSAAAVTNEDVVFAGGRGEDDDAQRAMIMAQIEALEQEKMFAEQFTRRSMSLAAGESFSMVLPEPSTPRSPPPVPAIPTTFHHQQQGQQQPLSPRMPGYSFQEMPAFQPVAIYEPTFQEMPPFQQMPEYSFQPVTPAAAHEEEEQAAQLWSAASTPAPVSNPPATIEAMWTQPLTSSDPVLSPGATVPGAVEQSMDDSKRSRPRRDIDPAPVQQLRVPDDGDGMWSGRTPPSPDGAADRNWLGGSSKGVALIY